jgi:glycosyltransferase involved in cell wall biosynthesis
MDREEKNLVSIIIPTYNRKNDIEECIKSVLKQSYKNCEIIVVDDFSSDATVKSIKENFPLVTILVNKKNKGVNYCRNAGIVASRGEYLLFLDSDMVFIHEAQIEIMIQKIRDLQNVGSLGGVIQKMETKVWGCNFDGSLKYSNSETELIECDYIPSGNLFLRRKEIFEQGGFDESLKGDGTESEIGMKIQQKGKKNLFGYFIAARHMASTNEQNNIGLSLPTTYSDNKKQQLRIVYRYRNRLRYFIKNGQFISGSKYLLFIMTQNTISFLAFIKQQFLGLKNKDSEIFTTFQQKWEVLLFKSTFIFDALVWNMYHLPTTIKSRKINFLYTDRD